MSASEHCPGYTPLKNLKAYMCKCQNCGQEKEIFSDEMDRPQFCAACGTQLDMSACQLNGEAKTTEHA
jgi:rRNA maturation endonuclease Nob1